jgi:hypothetical protein
MVGASWFRFRSKPSFADTSAIPDLSSLPSDDGRRIVAMRAAMRAYPGTAVIGAGPWALGAKVDLPIRLNALRALFVTWAGFLFDGVRPQAREEAFAALRPLLEELDEGLPDFYARNIMSSDYAVASWQDSTEAARRAVALVEAIDTLEFRPLEFDRGKSYRDSLDTLSLYGPDGRNNTARWRAAQREAIAVDFELVLERSLSPRDLALAPLWPAPESAALETNLTSGLTQRNYRELGSHIQTWLHERKDGALVLGKEPEEVADCIVKAASLPAPFWEKRAPEDTLYAFDYCLLCYLDNPNWGSETMTRIR